MAQSTLAQMKQLALQDKAARATELTKSGPTPAAIAAQDEVKKALEKLLESSMSQASPLLKFIEAKNQLDKIQADQKALGQASGQQPGIAISGEGQTPSQGGKGTDPKGNEQSQNGSGSAPNGNQQGEAENGTTPNGNQQGQAENGTNPNGNQQGQAENGTTPNGNQQGQAENGTTPNGNDPSQSGSGPTPGGTDPGTALGEEQSEINDRAQVEKTLLDGVNPAAGNQVDLAHQGMGRDSKELNGGQGSDVTGPEQAQIDAEIAEAERLLGGQMPGMKMALKPDPNGDVIGEIPGNAPGDDNGFGNGPGHGSGAGSGTGDDPGGIPGATGSGGTGNGENGHGGTNTAQNGGGDDGNGAGTGKDGQGGNATGGNMAQNGGAGAGNDAKEDKDDGGSSNMTSHDDTQKPAIQFIKPTDTDNPPPAQVVGALSPKDRAAIAQFQDEKTPPEYANLVQQYQKDLNDSDQAQTQKDTTAQRQPASGK
jgi:hypothetical protein